MRRSGIVMIALASLIFAVGAGVAVAIAGTAAPAGTSTVTLVTTAPGTTMTVTYITTDTTTTATPSAPGAPTLKSAVAGADGISLTWSASSSTGSSPLKGFHLYRSSPGGLETQPVTVGLVDTFVDTWAEPGTTYTYAVTAFSDAGESARSNELSATATGPPPRLLQPYQAIPAGSSPEAVAIGDVTGDGRKDVVLTTGFDLDPAYSYRLLVFAQAADGTLSPPVSYPTGGTYRPVSVAIGDITGDGRADVAVALYGVAVEVFPQLAAGTLGSPVVTRTGDSDKIRIGRLDGDSTLDVAAIGWGTNTVSVLLNDRSGGLRAPVIYGVEHGGYDDLEVADVSGDGRDDLVVMSGQLFSAPNVSVLAQLPGGVFGHPAGYRIGTNVLTNGIGVGDVTGDGRLDVVASYGGNSPSSQLAVLAQTSAGTLAAAVSYPSLDIPEPVEVADLDVDGLSDVVTLHGGWNAAGVYRQSAAVALGAEELFGLPYATHYNPHGLAVGDVNGDWSPDVVLADYNHGLVVLRNTTPVDPHADVPGKPTLTSATPGSGGVALAWGAPASSAPISGYYVYRGTASGQETVLAHTGRATSYTDTTAVDGTRYYYEVSAVNLMGEGPRSDEVAAPPVTAPGAPTLKTAAAGNSSVALAWSAPVSDGGAAVTGYRVHRRTSAGGEVTTAVGNVTTFTDTAVANGTNYVYDVSAVNSKGEGPRSNELAATPQAPDTTAPTTPSSPRLVIAGTNQLALAWGASSDAVGVAGYRVYRNGALVTTADATNVLDSGLAAGTTYKYAVRAVDAAGNQSPLSGSVSAKTLTLGKGSTGTLAGAVYDGGGKPLANAVVSVPGKSTKANASGVWKLGNLAPAAYVPTVSLAGYRSQSPSMTAVAGKTVLAVAVLARP